MRASVCLLVLAVSTCYVSSTAPRDFSGNLRCSSNRNGTAQCRPPGDIILGSVSVASKMSSSSTCTLDETFGILTDGRGVWATSGCKAVFSISGLIWPHETVNIECFSEQNKPKQCRPERNVTLTSLWVEHRHSRSACREDVNYGITSDRRGVWVNHGCRALFVGFLLPGARAGTVL
ncbi:hypothetical protein BaRGS_00028218 [Batillaria attramentaria]